MPVMIHMDQGRKFESDLFQAFNALLGVVKTRTTPCHPSSNGQMETYNQLVLNFLQCFLAMEAARMGHFLAFSKNVYIYVDTADMSLA